MAQVRNPALRDLRFLCPFFTGLKSGNSGIFLAFLSRIQEYHLKANFVAEQNAILSGINVEQINELARKYFDPSRMSVLVVGDKDKLMPGLRKFGFTVVELDADGNIK